MKKKNDIILISVLILLAAVSWLAVTLLKHDGAAAVVTIDGEEAGRYPLDTDTQVTFGEGDHYNILVIKDGYADVTEASCPDKICVRQNKIKYDGETIICLPNKLTVEISGGEKSETDTSVN